MRVQGERFDPEIRKELEKLALEVPDRFQIVTVTRAERARYIDKGRQLERDAPQLELFDTAKLLERQRAREREAQQKLRERINQKQRDQQQREREQLRQALTVAKHRAKVMEREAREKARQERERAERERHEVRRNGIEVQRKDLARVVEHNTRAIELARAEGITLPVRELSAAHRSAVTSLRQVRAFERSDAREMIAGLGLKGQAARDMEKSLAEGRERQRPEVRQGIDAMGAAAHEQKIVAQRDEQWQERKRERQKELEGMVRTQQIREDEVRVRLATEFPTSPAEVARDKARGIIPDDAVRLRQARQLDGLARERTLHRER